MTLNETALVLDLEHLSARFSAVAGNEIHIAAGGLVSEPSPYHEERLLVTNAIAARQMEFYSGRYFARAALLKAGHPPLAILRGKKGDPIWPPGFTGSITHDEQQVIAIAAHADSLEGIGVDLVACATKVESHLKPLITSDAELFLLAKLFPDFAPLALAFSLKESIVKAISPTIDHYLDLLDIQLIADGGSCRALVLDFEFLLDCVSIKNSTAMVTFACLSR